MGNLQWVTVGLGMSWIVDANFGKNCYLRQHPVAPKHNPHCMKFHWTHYLDHQRWLPMLIVLVIGLVGGFGINMAFGDELEMLGIIIASVLGGFFLCLLSLVFYVLRQIHQRARWENDNFQILMKARIKSEQETRLHAQAIQQQEAKAFLSVVEASFANTKTLHLPETAVVAALHQAMALATDQEKPLTSKLTELQAIVSQLKS